jgi:hypothetical protein
VLWTCGHRRRRGGWRGDSLGWFVSRGLRCSEKSEYQKITAGLVAVLAL